VVLFASNTPLEADVIEDITSIWESLSASSVSFHSAWTYSDEIGAALPGIFSGSISISGGSDGGGEYNCVYEDESICRELFSLFLLLLPLP